MKRKLKSIFIISIVSISLFAAGFISFISWGGSLSSQNPEPLYLGPEFRDRNLPIHSSLPIEGLSASSLPRTSQVTKDWLYLDNYYGYYDWAEYNLRAVGMFTEIWVQSDLTYPYREDDVITDEQIAYMLNEFETNIYPKDSEYYGQPDTHDGSMSLLEAWGFVPPDYYVDSDAKQVVLVSNIRDRFYYDPDYPYFVVGFYSPSYEAYFDRNIITIDSLRWEDFLGGYKEGNRYVYEPTFAHEYQHLIHDDYLPDDDLFMNEGCSMLAEVICGYPPAWGDINAYFATPDNSLTIWGDQGDYNILADYGQGLLWTTYLIDTYGDDFISWYMANTGPSGGIDGIETTLAYYGADETTFDEVFHNWRITNLIHDGDYDYDTLDLKYAIDEGLINPIRVYEVDRKKVPWTTGSSFGTSLTYFGGDIGIANIASYGVDYFEFNKLMGLNILSFDGNGDSYYGWQYGGETWWSCNGDNVDRMLTANAYVDPEDPWLHLITSYDIEPYWDFGFVQISTDDGATWTSLENEYTWSGFNPDWPLVGDEFDEPWQTMFENMPGITGYSDGIIEMDFDLTEYEEQNVMIGFRYMTDWYTSYVGWYIHDGTSVSGVPLEYNPVSETVPVDEFMVTLIEVFHSCGRKSKVYYGVYDLILDELHSSDIATFAWGHTEIYLIVTPKMSTGFTDYAFKVQKPKWHWCMC